MDWLIPSLIANLVGTSIPAVLFFCLYAQDRQPYLKIWAYSWATCTLYFGVQLFKSPYQKPDLAITAAQVTILAIGILLLHFHAKRAESKRRETHIQANLDNAAIGICQMDPHGQFIWANQCWMEMTGYSVEEFHKMSCLQIVHPNDFEFVEEQIKNIWRNECQAFQIEKRFVRKDGSIFWGNMSVSALRSPTGVLEAVTGIIMDITERTRTNAALAESEERFRLLYQDAPLAYQSLDGTGRILDVNQAWIKELGYAPEEVVGRSFVDFLAPDQKGSFLASFPSLTSNGRVSGIELKMVCKDATQILMAVNGNANHDEQGQCKQFHCILTNITERKEAEAALHRKTYQQERLLETARHLTESTELERVLRQIGTGAREILETEGCILYLLEKDGRTLTPVVAVEPAYEAEILATPAQVEDSFTGQAVMARCGLIFNDVTSGGEGTQIPGTSVIENERLLVAPLIVDDQVRGAMCLNRIGRLFTHEDLALAETFALFASAVLKKAEAHAQLQCEVEERKQAEDALRNSEARYRSLFENAPISLWEEDFSALKAEIDCLQQAGITDMPTYLDHHPDEVIRLALLAKVIDVNQATIELFQAKDKLDLLGDLQRISTDETFKTHKESILAISESKDRLDAETQNRSLTGENIHVALRWSIAPGYKESYAKALVSIIDISKRKQAEEALRRKTYQQERLIETARHLTEILDLQQVLRQIATGAQEILDAIGCAIYMLESDGKTLTPVVAVEPGYEQEILAAQLDIDTSFTGQAVKAGHGMIFNNYVAGGPGVEIPGTPVIDDERVMVAPFMIDDEMQGAMCLNRNGTVFTAEDLALAETFAAYASTILKNAQTLEKLQREVEERKQAQQALLESEERYRSLFQANDSVMLLFDPDTFNIMDANPAACKYYGYTLQELTNMKITGINQLTESEAAEETQRAKDEQREYSLAVHQLANGEQRHVEVYSGPITLKGNQLFYSIIHDVTERVKRKREMEAILAMATALRSAQGRAGMLPVILEQVQSLLGTDGAALAMRDPLNGETVFELATGVAAGLTNQHLPAGTGISGYVLSTGQSYLSNDVNNDPRNITIHPLTSPSALAAVPLISHDETIGALLISRNTSIDEAEVRLLAAVGEIAANAIQRASLHEQTQRRVKRLDALHNIDKAITTTFSLEFILKVVLDQVTSQLGVDAAGILLFDPHTQNLVYAAASGFHSNAILNSEVRVGKGNAGQVALLRRMVRVDDLRAETSDFGPGQSEKFISYYGVPLIAKGQVKGVLEVYQRDWLHPDQEWLNFLDTLARQLAIAIDNTSLFEDLQRSNLELRLAYDTTLEGWASALEMRDRETEGHSQRVTAMTLKLARAMGISGEDLVHLRRGTTLHDIGKMAIPDHILLKSGPLTDHEWEIMRQHPSFAYKLLSDVPFLRPALDIPYCHHEKWDGTGYPRALKGDQIPLSARIFAIIDVWDALLSDRPYRSAWTEEQTRAYIQEQSGKHFDPQVVAAFFEMQAGKG